MAKQYKNFLKNLKSMNIEDIDITAQELEESIEQPVNEEIEYDGRDSGRGRKNRKSFREYTDRDNE